MAEYGNRLLTQINSPHRDDLYRDGLKWADVASEHITQATLAVMTPGIMLATLEAGRLMDDILDRLYDDPAANVAAFMVYLPFLVALSFAYCSTKYRIHMNVQQTGRLLSADEADKCFISVAKGTRVAKIVVETSEQLYLDQVFKHFSDKTTQ